MILHKWSCYLNQVTKNKTFFHLQHRNVVFVSKLCGEKTSSFNQSARRKWNSRRREAQRREEVEEKSFAVIPLCIFTESKSIRFNLISPLSGSACYRRSNTKSKQSRMHLNYLPLDIEVQERPRTDDEVRWDNPETLRGSRCAASGSPHAHSSLGKGLCSHSDPVCHGPIWSILLQP